MAVCYLEVDDEITTAIKRIRAVRDTDAIVVVPPGSRIATSRINFKLLAREATERHMNLVAVSDEPQVRALAISAGLPAYDSIPSAEQALATFQEQDRQLAERLSPASPPVAASAPASIRAEHTMVLPARGSTDVRGAATPTAATAPAARGSAPATKASVPSPSDPLSSSTSPRATAVADAERTLYDTAVLPAFPAATSRARKKRRIPVAPLLVLGLVAILILGVGYGAYVLLPTASITLRPTASQIQVPTFAVTADPNVAVVDVDAGVIPAQQISVPVHVEGSFNATGIDAHDVRATGSVRFKSENTVSPVSILKNTVVSTPDGVDFVTLDDTVMPKASFETGPTQVDVDVRAVKGGIAGNVDTDTITVLPAAISEQVITVTNPDPTSGGKHTEDQVVTQDDYDAAVATLSGQLDAALQTALADPQSVPRGLVAFPQTAQMSTGQPDRPSSSVVGVIEQGFALALDATANLTAVNEAQIDQVASARLSDSLVSGQKLVGSGVDVVHDVGTVVGNTVVYNVQASGLGYMDPDPQALVNVVRGKALVDARAALASFGVADITLWPDFVDHLPDQGARISVIVVAPSPAPSRVPASLTPALTPAATPAAPAAS